MNNSTRQYGLTFGDLKHFTVTQNSHQHPDPEGKKDNYLIELIEWLALL